MSSRTVRAAGVVGAVLGAAVTYWLYPDALLAATAGLCWGGGTALTVRERAAWGGSAEPSLADGLPGVLVVLVGLFGIHGRLGIPDSLRWALVVLAVGAIFCSTGIGAALGRRAANGSPAPAD